MYLTDNMEIIIFQILSYKFTFVTILLSRDIMRITTESMCAMCSLGQHMFLIPLLPQFVQKVQNLFEKSRKHSLK